MLEGLQTVENASHMGSFGCVLSLSALMRNILVYRMKMYAVCAVGGSDLLMDKLAAAAVV